MWYQYPIIGADLTKRYGLLPDLKDCKLIDPINVFNRNVVKTVSTMALSTINPAIKFAHTLAEFPEVIRFKQSVQTNKSDV